MTIKEVTNQLFQVSVAGYFNGEKFEKQRLENYIRKLLSPEKGSQLIMTIALPDGWWYFQITRYGIRADEVDYTIPETRQQEAYIKEKLLEKKFPKNQIKA